MRILIGLAAALALATTSAQAADLQIDHAWARPAAVGGNSAAYLTITNTGSKPDRLLSVSSPVAKTLELHRSMVMGGKAMMEPAADGVALPAGTTAVFAPGGYHIMLIGLKGPLKAGDTVPATLTFQTAGKVAVTFTVETSKMPSMPGMSH